jgi:transcriptional regulator with XRE-family HTH domain
MKERIKEFIDSKGIQPGELAVLLEVQRSNISHILNGRNKPGASLIEKMLNVFPELNARWLLTGEGDMLFSEDANDSNSAISDEKHIITDYITDKSPKSVKKQIDKVILLYNDGSFTAFNK